MLNQNDKKGIAAVILLLIIILGSLVFIRGCDKKDLKNDSIVNPPEEVVPIVEEDTSQSSDSTMYDTEENQNISVICHEVLSENQESPEIPILDFETYYQVEIGNKSFELPVVSEFDSKGNPQAVIITYYFKSIYENDYRLVDFLSFQELGTYQVHYQVTNSIGQTTIKDLWIDVIDQAAPIIEGFIEEYDESTGLISYIPVSDNSRVKNSIHITFSDNDKIVYASYYKAIYENIGGEDTLEQEALMNVIDIDLTEEFYLYEDGEYHIRAYDEAGNYSEYVIIIDRTNPVIEVSYAKLDTNQVLVTITSDEEVKEVDGFTLSNDKKSLTKTYTVNTQEEVTICDLAGNTILVPIVVDQILTVKVLQNGMDSESRQLNRNDGVISVIVEGNSNYQITYSLDSSSNIIYTSGESLVLDGHYDFTITGDIGVILLSLDISSQMTID